ncbi:MAG: hypothetical protein N2378_02555 [Chloroflexaceae bacterium]|nr:hypothetical protein [Chloroflexaceae bacterium]
MTAAPAALRAMLALLGRLERGPAEALAAHQQRQLDALVAHAAAHSPLFRRRLAQAGLRAGATFPLEALPALAPMTRRELQAAGDDLFCAVVPPAHQPVTETRTSGSSGEPVTVRRTGHTQLYWLAHTLREHLWWQRDFAGTLAVIRANLDTERIRQDDWGPPARLFFSTGPAHAMSMALDIATQARWLAEIDPHYLLTYPSNLAELLRQCARDGIALSRLRQVRTIGETLTDGLRAEVGRQ